MCYCTLNVQSQPAAPTAAQINSLLGGLNSFSNAFTTTMQDISAPTSSPSTSTNGSSSSSSSSTGTVLQSSDVRSAFIGNWQPIPGICTPSATCCCGNGVATMTDGTTASTIQFSGPTSGGSGCYNMNTLAGTFNVINDELAQYNVSALSTIVKLQLNGTNVNDPYQTLTMSLNSAQYTCTQPIKFQRTTHESTTVVTGDTTIPSGSMYN